MKEKIMTIILVIVMLVLIACLTILGLVVYATFQGENNEVTKFLGSTYELINHALSQKEQNNSDNNLSVLQENDNLNSNTNQIPKYYYEQLDEYAKIIYNKLEANIENSKTGTYKIEFGDTFDNLLKQDEGYDILGKSYQSAIETFFYDNPGVFYLEPNKMYINIKKTTSTFKITHNVYIDSGKQENYLTDTFNTKEKIEQAEAQLEQIKNNLINSIMDKDDYDKILTIHDFLIDNISYDETVSKDNIYNIYGALVSKECVCEGYAKAFKYLLDEVNIENIIVIGTAVNSRNVSENHAWNYVKMQDNWYAVDTTWDDPIIKGIGFVGNDVKYKYFLIGNDINNDHTLINQFTTDGQTYIYPSLSESSYKKK